MNGTKKRIYWVDSMKAIGIFSFYLAHMPFETDKLYMFLYTFNVIVFVFASGALAKKSSEMPLKEFIIRKVKQILVPYFTLGAFNIAVRAFCLNAELSEIIFWARQLIKGQRNNIFAVAMWFLPCIFCISVIYHILQKSIKNKWVLLAVCTIASLVIRFAIEGPQWWWSIDSAIRYLFYYALADCSAEHIENFSFNKLGRVQKAFFSIATFLAFAIFALYYQFGRGYFPSLAHIELGFHGQIVEMIALTVISLYCILVISKYLEHIPVLQKIGSVSLALCIAEMPVKLIVPTAFEAIGLQMQYTTPMHSVVCCIIFLLAGYYGMAMPIQKYFPCLLGRKSRTG